jgi:phage gpG-like protein
MKPITQLLADFRKDNEAVKEVIKKLPRIIGNASKQSIDNNFKLQGYFDGKRTKFWEERKPATNKAYDARGKAYKGRVFNSKNPILIQTGKLRNSIRYKEWAKKVFVYVDLAAVPYAQAHNEGLTIEKKASRKEILYRTTTSGRKIFASAEGKGRGKNQRARTKATGSMNVKVGAHSIKMPQRQFMPTPNEDGNADIYIIAKDKFNTMVHQALKDLKV